MHDLAGIDLRLRIERQVIGILATSTWAMSASAGNPASTICAGAWTGAASQAQ